MRGQGAGRAAIRRPPPAARLFLSSSMSQRPLALVIRAAGTNCEGELCRAFEDAGARVDLVHIDRLTADPDRILRADLLAIPGGFSYGDDIASGRIFAARLRERLWPQLREAAQRGTPMFGPCNGFQVLVQVGLLPGPAAGEDWPEEPPRQTVALCENATGRFIDRWGVMRIEPNTRCLWTSELPDGLPDEIMQLPIAHGEGRFVPESPETLRALEERGQVVLRYAENLNGSAGAVAGICDAGGRIFGLMPHPERYTAWNRHPFWTRLDRSVRSGPTPAQIMFRTAVEAAAKVPA